MLFFYLGTRKERGLEAWNSSEKYSEEDFICYDIPWLRCITDLPFMKYVPISPAFAYGNAQWPKQIFPCSQREEEEDDEPKEDEAIEMN